MLVAGNDAGSDHAGARPQLRRQATGDAETDNAWATLNVLAGICDRRRELGG
jgi:hypothetical protein